ncbi:Hypothetical protein NTJ_16188 [Nesidiocoris tenuis]|uniref:Uncharacterized protein n=1 Tax=Nesidiocoris tenuis TaxID=355587 RepID=A0ABN7BHA4_9HEMI|nr:Hypothetical protein NTJ_16188 [Nesidiocoris tenuis]
MRVWNYAVWAVLLVAPPIEGSPVPRKCPVSDGLLNQLVGNGVSDKGEFEAEEEAIGLAGDPLTVDLSQLTQTNGSPADLKDCLQEYGKQPVNPISRPEAPPGGSVNDDASQIIFLPFTAVKEEALPDKGDYFTTYDASKYNFKDKGYIIEAPAPIKESPPPTSVETTRRPKSAKNRNEIEKWYNALVSVVADYV